MFPESKVVHLPEKSSDIPKKSDVSDEIKDVNLQENKKYFSILFL